MDLSLLHLKGVGQRQSLGGKRTRAQLLHVEGHNGGAAAFTRTAASKKTKQKTKHGRKADGKERAGVLSGAEAE